MKIPRAKIVRESREVVDARHQKVQAERDGKEGGRKVDGFTRRGEGRVDVSLSKNIAKLEEERREKVEELKQRYQNGEKLEYPTGKVAAAVGDAITEEVFFARLFGQAGETPDTDE